MRDGRPDPQGAWWVSGRDGYGRPRVRWVKLTIDEMEERHGDDEGKKESAKWLHFVTKLEYGRSVRILGIL